jgi:hypothetical protein
MPPITTLHRPPHVVWAKPAVDTTSTRAPGVHPFTLVMHSSGKDRAGDDGVGQDVSSPNGPDY